MPRIGVLSHAAEDLRAREILLDELMNMIEGPEATAAGYDGRVVSMRRSRPGTFPRPRLICAVVELGDDTVTFVTAYATSKISKYLPDGTT